jgi:PleD family two-component response regulator
MYKARVVIVDDSSFSVMLLTDILVERGFDAGNHFDSLLASASTDFGEIKIHVGFCKGSDRWMQN